MQVSPWKGVHLRRRGIRSQGLGCPILGEQGSVSTLVQQSATLLSSPQDTEIINTAILTGRTVAIPVKVIAIEVTGLVLDVSALVECESDNEEIIKVSFPEVGPLGRRPQTFEWGAPSQRGTHIPCRLPW